jgi:Uma2 family endonuclease
MSTVRLRDGRTRLTGVTYDDYVRRRADPAYDGKRMTYLDGVLELMSPEYVHERGGSRLHHVVLAYCEAFDVNYEEAGATTFREGVPGEKKGAGNEADRSFYLGDAATAVAGKKTLNLAVDDPPTLWIEVDNTTSSIPRLPLYARLRVPELWRYEVEESTLWFGRLVEGVYEDVTASAALPGLTPAIVLGLLAQGPTLTTSEWVRWLERTWFPEHRRELIDAGAGR